MPEKIKAVPDGFRTVTPFLSIQGASDAIKFYQKAFGAEQIERHDALDGKVMHAVLRIGDSLIMLADEFPEYNSGVSSPVRLTGSCVVLHLYVDNVDDLFNKAVQAGAKVIMPVEDRFWGDRYGQLQDPFGHHWSVAAHIADLTSEEIEKGAQECFCEPVKSSCC